MLKIYEPNMKVVTNGPPGSSNRDEPEKIILRKQIKRNWSP